MQLVGEDDPCAGQYTIGVHDVLRAHFLIADFFLAEGTGIGGVGPRSIELLHSAVYRQFATYGGISKWSDEFEVCGTLFFGLIKDHPFHDANKRTAFLVALYHLEKLGRCITVSRQELEDFAVRTADRQLSHYSRYGKFERQSDPEVRFVADFLRRNSRDIDKRSYAVTFRELDQILRRFGYGLENPDRNYIDVVRIEERRAFMGIVGKKETRRVKIGVTGFPGWTREVGIREIKQVRRMTELDFKHGVDSAVFYKGADSMKALIAVYQEQLRRLADR